FGLRVTRDQKAAALATILFLLNGGFGFIYFFLDWWKSGKRLVQFWNKLVFSIFAIVWQRWHESPHDKIDQANLPSTRTLMLVAGVLTGLLPWFHTHTYIAVGLISVVLFAFRP